MDGDRFWKMPECYIRGQTVKYFRLPDDVVDKIKEDVHLAKTRYKPGSGDNRGGFRGRGRGGQRGGRGGGGNPRGQFRGPFSGGGGRV